MEELQTRHRSLRTILSFALIPLSGFATDIYVPSLPSIATQLHAPASTVQLTLIVFMISYGIAQVFVGSLLDSFGRFKLGTASLFLFAIASFAIALSSDINVIQAMRVVQGVTAALIVVSKRAFFIDTFSGNRLKHYTSLFSIIWATAPIVAPFIGAYLQQLFGWQSNFYFLGGYTLLIMALELIYGAESLKTRNPFKVRPIFDAYLTVVRTTDYMLGLVIVSLNYAMLVIYSMSSPFLIEHRYFLSPIITGYCSLLSGISFMLGGIISKLLIARPFNSKMLTAILFQFIVTILMAVTSGIKPGIYTLMAFTLVIHLLSGFSFNNVFAYCLQRFTKNTGIASGITGGGLYILTSVFSYGLAHIIAINDQQLLAFAYMIFALLTCTIFYFFRLSKDRLLSLSLPA
ncbi:MFS transporter [Mucilaginibacter sp.]|jgi:MFS family permease|uniref:MFS transporter n=1 Tax=Mucilaginibacter sp. TaxID=1882438 RepID=UPI003562E0C6